MGFVKQHLLLLIFGVVGLASIGAGVFGVKSMAAVRTQMTETLAVADKLNRLKRQPVNTQVIDVEETRISRVSEQFDDVISRAHALNRFEPLVQGAFPTPTRETKLRFRDAYRAAMGRILLPLKAGSPPTPQDVDDIRRRIAEERDRERRMTGDPGAGETTTAPPYRSGLMSHEQARWDPAARASIARAREIHCYSAPDALQYYGPQELVFAGITPNEADMWDAQMRYWIQDDVVRRLAAVNDAAAAEITAAGELPWVGVLPIKEFVSVRISGEGQRVAYIFGDSPARAPSRPDEQGPSFPAGAPHYYFTGTVSNDLYDVVQFSVKLVADVRDIPVIVDGLCTDNFHTLLRVDYVYQPANLRMTGKIYGSEPIATVVMDFETLFLGDIYRRLMPDVILDALGVSRPADDD